MPAVRTSSERVPAVPTSSETVVTLPTDVDLHARPAAEFVRTAFGFKSTVTVSSNGREADAKSLLAVLALGAKRGTTLRLFAEGDDAGAALEALAGCIVDFRE
jgi:phosphocarrier protein HPr